MLENTSWLWWVISLGLMALGSASPGWGQGKGPTDWSDWEKYRGQVVHPATTIKPEDLARAQDNLRRYAWAQEYVARLRESADRIAEQVSPDYLERMIEPTTPGCVGPCPACRDQGRPWHPNGQWSWSPDRPDQLQCAVCKTVFPHPDYPEDIVLECKWGRGQKFSFIGGETFRCFGYRDARPSLSGIIRARKVNHVTGQLSTAALAYALTEEPKYARAAKAILLRFAEVFPEYLVRAGYGYGEYAGMDPHVAAERIDDLPEDELVYPPNKPDRKIYAGYWAASRIGTSGMDGWWVAQVTEAYDLTCMAEENGVPIYSEEEKMRIERDVLLESTYLAVCDPAINNKSVGNRAGAAMVGLCVGHPGLVHFGLEGFQHTVDGWFLPDGGTSESPAYALMTMSGIRPFGLAFRDYSDPPGYVGPDGQRLDGFNAGRDTRYGDCWQGLLWTLQGDLRFPPSADSYRTTEIGASFAELIALVYPSEQHLAFLKEVAGEELAGGSPREAIFYREPGLEARPTPPFHLPDMVFPCLAQGYLRTGPTGRDSLALLNASDWGGHHHLDSLNLYYWKDGRELLSDLGYLWDHPDSYQTRRTFAHNLVVVDGQDQRGDGRGGQFHLFSVTPHVKVMEASSNAYAAADLYRRTCVVIDHGEAGSYLVDIFRASGGKRREYVFHGPGNEYEVTGLTWVTPSAEVPGVPLANPRQAQSIQPWYVTWSVGEDYLFQAFAPGRAEETVVIGDGWGQRDHRNTDVGATLPYVIRRGEGTGDDVFVSVFAGAPRGKTLVQGVQFIPLPDGSPPHAVALAVETTRGIDVVVSQLEPQPLTVSTAAGTVTTDGRLAAVLRAKGEPMAASLVGGSYLEAGEVRLTLPTPVRTGQVLDVGGERGASYFVVEGLTGDKELVGRVLFALDGGTRRAYPIVGIEEVEGQTRVFTKRHHQGFEAQPAERWELPLTVDWERID